MSSIANSTRSWKYNFLKCNFKFQSHKTWQYDDISRDEDVKQIKEISRDDMLESNWIWVWKCFKQATYNNLSQLIKNAKHDPLVAHK